MGNRGHEQELASGEATIVSMSDEGEAEIRFPGGARVMLTLTADQVASYRTAQLAERARAGTLISSASADRWPSEGAGDLVIGDRNWFYC